MFTGLIQSLGTVLDVRALKQGLEIVFQPEHPEDTEDIWSDIKEGDSIAINGVCSTAMSLTKETFTVQYLNETLQKSTMGTLKKGDKVNLELSLRASDRLGGHYVSGHSDEIGQIVSLEQGDPWGEITVKGSDLFNKFLIPKGSIAIHGISLTIVNCEEGEISCHLIPHTLNETNLHHLSVGDKVNLEYDIIGKYLYNFYRGREPEREQG